MVGMLVLARPGWAFDAGPHADITRDALTAEGFGNTAVQVVQVNNWYVDLYENSNKLPHSGHASGWHTFLGGGVWDSENWSQAMVDAADRSHFDSSNGGFSTTAALTAEWDRLQRAVYTLSRQAAAADNPNPVQLLTVLGISLHQVQDFYAHSNWVEPKGIAGYEGPGWAARNLGDASTWFDMAAKTRIRETLYVAGSPGITRGHGDWRTDNNVNLATGMNKDWPGRPLYEQAHMAAYFATRQWVRAVRIWVNNESFWRSVQSYANRANGDLDHDVKGMTGISVYSGHWQGQGEPLGASAPGPGGSLLDLRQATNHYFEDRARTHFRTAWENLIQRVADPSPPAATVPAPTTSQPLQKLYRFVRLQINHLSEVDDLDLSSIDQADYFVQAAIDGQPFRSAMLNGFDTFNFPRPNYPFTWLKAVPNSRTMAERLCNLRIEVATADVSSAGTDDTVSLRINDSTAFTLDKPLYDDFERGDRDTYSCAIDSRVLTMGDIQYIQIGKSRDGAFGGWKLGGVKVYANGRLIYQNDAISRWLEDDTRTWRAPNFTRTNPAVSALPVEIRLYDEDINFNDHCDIHPDFQRKDVILLYDPILQSYRGDFLGGGPMIARGDDRFGGRLLGDDSRAQLRFQVLSRVPRPLVTLDPRRPVERPDLLSP
jgi:hypothetical protein